MADTTDELTDEEKEEIAEDERWCEAVNFHRALWRTERAHEESAATEELLLTDYMGRP